MSHSWAFDIYKKAKSFPSLVGRCDYTITFTLGEDDFSWSVGSKSEKFLGTVKNLTGATVTLVMFKLPESASVMDIASGYGPNSSYEVFNGDATLTDAANGICTVAISNTDLDCYGEVIGEIRITESGGNIVCPGQFRTKIIRRLSL